MADSGDLDADLGGVFREVGETADNAGIGVLFTIDEIQYMSKAELGALIVGLHRVSQLGLPLMVAGAGLPSLPGLAGEARSYAERLFSYVEIDSLGPEDARRALVEPVESEGSAWDDPAVDRIIDRTQGYPYFLQEFGKQAWNVAQGDTITTKDVDVSVALALDDLDQGSSVRESIRPLTPSAIICEPWPVWVAPARIGRAKCPKHWGRRHRRPVRSGTVSSSEVSAMPHGTVCWPSPSQCSTSSSGDLSPDC